MEAGARLAFRQAHGHAGPHAVRLVRLDSTSAPGEPWDPGQVQTNAEKARDDPSAVAYIGELGLGASAVSLPVTNDGDLLQIAPLESLTSLTRAPPGRAARGAPDRYYPTGRRTFLRLVPNDLRVADLITARVSELDAERVALVTGEGVYAEELTSQVAERSAPRRAHGRADGRDRRRPEGTAIARGAADGASAGRDRLRRAGGSAGRAPAECARAIAARHAGPHRSRRARPCAAAVRCSAGACRGVRAARTGGELRGRRAADPRGVAARAATRRGPRRSTATRPRAWCSTPCARAAPGAPRW